MLVMANVTIVLIKVRINNYAVCLARLIKNLKKKRVLRRFKQFQEKHDTKIIFLKYYFIIAWQTYSNILFAEPCVP